MHKPQNVQTTECTSHRMHRPQNAQATECTGHRMHRPQNAQTTKNVQAVENAQVKEEGTKSVGDELNLILFETSGMKRHF